MLGKWQAQGSNSIVSLLVQHSFYGILGPGSLSTAVRRRVQCVCLSSTLFIWTILLKRSEVFSRHSRLHPCGFVAIESETQNE